MLLIGKHNPHGWSESAFPAQDTAKRTSGQQIRNTAVEASRAQGIPSPSDFFFFFFCLPYQNAWLKASLCIPCRVLAERQEEVYLVLTYSTTSSHYCNNKQPEASWETFRQHYKPAASRSQKLKPGVIYRKTIAQSKP